MGGWLSHMIAARGTRTFSRQLFQALNESKRSIKASIIMLTTASAVAGSSILTPHECDRVGQRECEVGLVE